MNEKRKKRERSIESIFKVYNGSAVSYNLPKTSLKSISSICSSGSAIAKGTSVSDLIDEIRK